MDRRRPLVRAGIREAKAHLSSLLRRVRSGQVIEITDRGVPIARIAPVVPSGDALAHDRIVENLVRKGYLTRPPARRRAGLPPLVAPTAGFDAQEMLRADRDVR